MSDAAELRAIREEIAALAAKIGPKPRKPHDTRPQIIVRVQPSDMALVDAAAEQRGVNRSAFVRDAISAAVGTALQQPKAIPAGLRRDNRRKPISEHAAQNTRLNRADAAREAARLGIAARQAFRDYDAATARQAAPAMMVGTTAVPIVPKLPKSGG